MTAGTIFQDSHLPLTVWCRAMWHVISQKNGVSALGLQRSLGLGSDRTAWALLHKLRRAMVRPGCERLRGRVEVDETYGGSPESGLHGRQKERKMLIVDWTELLPRVHRVASLLKRWLPGTHQGAVRGKQLVFYLDEFTFRFNQRKSASRGKLFFRLAQQAMAVEPHPLAKLRQTTSC